METVLPQFTPTVTNLISSSNPSTVGQTVTFTAQLKYTSAQNTSPTGIVTFTDTNTGTMLGTGKVQTSGGGPAVSTAASIATSSLAAGSYAIQAAYSGDNIYSRSSSQIVTQVVGQGAPRPHYRRRGDYARNGCQPELQHRAEHLDRNSRSEPGPNHR